MTFNDVLGPGQFEPAETANKLKPDEETREIAATFPTYGAVETFIRESGSAVDVPFFYYWYRERAWRDRAGNRITKWKAEVLRWATFPQATPDKEGLKVGDVKWISDQQRDEYYERCMQDVFGEAERDGD